MKLTIRYSDGREVVEHCLGWGHATKIARERFRPRDGEGRARNDEGDPIAKIEYSFLPPSPPYVVREYCRPAECELRLRWLRDDNAGWHWAELFDERGGA